MIEHEILGLGLILDENEYVSDRVIKRTWAVRCVMSLFLLVFFLESRCYGLSKMTKNVIIRGVLKEL